LKPFAESSEQNKEPILEILKLEFADCHRVLEVGSGTGQHAVFFSEQLPHLHWICSDLKENHTGIRMWLSEVQHNNIEGPLLLDAREDWPQLHADAVFSANAIHIMSWQAVQGMIKNIGKVLTTGGKLCLYGPFMVDGQHTADSNAQFDVWLKNRDPMSGIRDVTDLTTLLNLQNMELVSNHKMPVNNRILVWQKV
jgi:cyclopropane fatty-acyl-phospholipid synthase-like methyltransferase